MEAVTAAEYWFKALLTLMALALATNVFVGSSQRWRPVFISGALTAAVACEYYYIFFAIMKVPSDWVDRTGVEMQRWDCRQSKKGGKNWEDDTSVFAINPCFCPADGFCKDLGAGAWVSPTVCPADSTGLCFDVNRMQVPLYIEVERDCKNAQGPRCTMAEPCTPCDLESIREYLEEGVSDISRCRRCEAGNRGTCNFVIDEGPYCWRSPWSTEVVPCTVCCTEPKAIHVNGSCY